MKYSIKTGSEYGICELKNDKITFTAKENCDNAFFTLDITFPEWKNDSFIMMPSCAYNGNRLKKSYCKYPPMYKPEEAGVNCEPLMTDVPALNPDGSGKIEVTSGDMATPCVGIFDREDKKSFFIFTRQEVKDKNIGFTVESGKIQISYPANREYEYRMCRLEKLGTDSGISVESGEEISSDVKIFTDDCQSIAEFYKQYFALRKSVMSDKRAEFIYTKELWDIMETHFNEENWSGEYYSEVTKSWQCGWVGGGMSNYPLLKYGTELSKERAISTIEFMTKHQAPSGFFYGKIKDGEILDDSFGVPGTSADESLKVQGMEGLHMTRKSADGLYFLFKNFTATAPKEEWANSAKKCADAFCTLFEKYGTFGQFVNNETGEMMVGCSLSASIAPAALSKAWEFFGEEKYLDVAKRSLEYCYSKFIETGFTNGGPGEILSAPDSESAFGLLESCVVMYEVTKDKKWLSYAETAAHYCSSWVMTYTYKFPKTSEFGKLNINTVGSIFANVQNKHSAPGICTLSGDSILKLYRYTGNIEYLELIKDIAYFIPQCVSTEKRPIWSWHNPPKKLLEGCICERVNTSDWENYDHIGGVFALSCWCETSLILSYVELMTEKEMLPE